jgi:predicted tellurium resistance membrane protein TerC
MNEHVLSAVIANDEAETFLAVEEFDRARAFADDLGRHTATRAAAAAETAAATAAGTEATAPAAGAAAEAITAAAESVATAEAAILKATAEIVATAETVALIPATPAALATASFIETHALFVFPVRPNSTHQEPTRRTTNAGLRSALTLAPRTRHSSNARSSRTNSSYPAVSPFNTCATVAPTAQQGAMPIAALVADPAAWAALVTLIVMEVVLGIDNLVFISILSNKLPTADRTRVRRVGIGLALILRLALLSMIVWIAGLTAPVIDLGLTGALDAHGEPSFETAFSVRDLILIAGGLFLLWKATREIHQTMSGAGHDAGGAGAGGGAALGFAAAIVQILLLDMVFSIDSILTAVGMTDHLPIMFAAVIVAVGAMLVAADPLADFISRNPTVVMLALSFLLMIGLVLIADGFGVHVPKGYIYTAMAFSAIVETLNILARKRRKKAGH